MGSRVSIEIVKAMYDIERRLDEMFKKQARNFGLSYSEFNILYSFTMDESPRTAQRLADENFMSKQTISSALARMDRKGWVSFERGKDKREKLISLTEKGIEVRRRTTDRLSEVDDRVMEEIGLEEIRRSLDTYRKYLDFMTGEYEKMEI